MQIPFPGCGDRKDTNAERSEKPEKPEKTEPPEKERKAGKERASCFSRQNYYKDFLRIINSD